MNPSSLLIILMTAVWVSVTTLSAATTNAAASIGPSVVGQVPVYTDTTGQLMTPSSSLTNFTFVTPVITVPGGYYNGAMLTPWVDTNNAISLRWKKAPQVWEFASASIAEWSGITFNSGSTTVPDGSTTDFGVFAGTTGALTNGGAGFRLGLGSAFGATTVSVRWRIFTPAALSSNADGYEIYVGVGDGTGDAEPVDGAYFYYLHSVSNGVWCAKTSSNSSRTFASGAASTPPTVTAAAWWDLLLEANSTAVNFWVSSDDGATWTWIGFSSSNIPTTTARICGIEGYIRKVGGSTGTTARILTFGRCVLWP